MGLYSLIGKISSPAVKGYCFKNLTNEMLKGSSAAYIIRQPYHHKLLLTENLHSKPCIFTKYKAQSNSFATSLMKFSTTTSQLSNQKSHDHSKIWSFERVLSALFLPLTPAFFMYPCQTLDTAMALILVMHTHFGLEAIIVDYIRPILFGDLAPKIGIFLLYVFSIATFAGLLNLIYNDFGLANTVLQIWKK